MKLRKELSPLDNISACKDAMIVDQRRQEDDGCEDAKRAKFTVVNNEGGGPEIALTRKYGIIREYEDETGKSQPDARSAEGCDSPCRIRVRAL